MGMVDYRTLALPFFALRYRCGKRSNFCPLAHVFTAIYVLSTLPAAVEIRSKFAHNNVGLCRLTAAYFQCCTVLMTVL